MKEQGNATQFIGTWSLLGCEHRLEDGSKTYPFGKDPKGILIYTAAGYMSGALMQPGRPGFKSHEFSGGTASERAQAMEGYLHYAGTFKVFDDHVLHYVELSLFPNWIGRPQKRYFKFVDENHLELSSDSFAMKNVIQTAHLSWQRLPLVF